MKIQFYNKISLIYEILFMRKKSFLYMIIPLVLLSVTVQSTAYFSINIENEVRPSITTSDVQSEINGFVLSGVPIIGSVSTQIWNHVQNYSKIDFSSYFSGLINSTFTRIGLNQEFLNSNAFIPIISAKVNGYQQPISIIGSDAIFQSIARSLNINSSVLSQQSVSFIGYYNFNDYKIPSTLNLSNTNFPLMTIGNISYDSLIRNSAQFIQLNYGFSSSIFSFVTSKTFSKLIQLNIVDSIFFDSILNFSSQGLYQLLYNTHYNGILTKFENTFMTICQNDGIIINIVSTQAITTASKNFQEVVLNDLSIWVIVSLFLIIPELVLVKFSITNSLFKFRKSYDLIKLHGTSFALSLIYFFIEICMLFFIQFPISKLFIYVLVNNFSPFGIKKSGTLPFSFFFFEFDLILFIFITFLYFYANKTTYSMLNITNPFTNSNSIENKNKLNYSKAFTNVFFGEIVLLVFTGVIYYLNTNSDIRFLSLDLIIILFILFIPELLIFLYKLGYKAIDYYSIKVNSKILGIKSLLISIRFSRIIQRIKLLFFVLVVFSTFFAFFLTYENNAILDKTYSAGSPVVIRSNIYNPQVVQNLTNLNGGSGVSITATSFGNDLGSAKTNFEQSFSVLAINPLTYPSLNNLNNPGYDLSNTSNVILNNLKTNLTILAQDDFLQAHGLTINDNITILTSSNSTIKSITLTIVGSFKLWPGFIEVPNLPGVTKTAVIMSFSTLENIISPSVLYSSSQFYFHYNVNPSQNFNFTKFELESNVFSLDFYNQKDIIDSFQQLIYQPAIFSIIFSATILIIRSAYEVEKDSEEMVEDFSIPKALGLSNEDANRILLFEMAIQIGIISFGAIFGIFFGFFLLQSLDLFNSFPIIFSFNYSLSLELIIIFSILSIIELLIAKLLYNKKNISEIISIED